LRSGEVVAVAKAWLDRLSNASIAVIAAALGALGTLGGAYLANANTENITNIQAQHDELIRQGDLARGSYVAFINAYEQYRDDVLTVRDEREQGPVSDSTIDKANADGVRLYSALDQMKIVGHAKPLALAQRAADTLDDWEIDTKAKELQKLADHADSILDEFVSAARSNLAH
jgi:hypothetical protein